MFVILVNCVVRLAQNSQFPVIIFTDWNPFNLLLRQIWNWQWLSTPPLPSCLFSSCHQAVPSGNVLILYWEIRFWSVFWHQWHYTLSATPQGSFSVAVSLLLIVVDVQLVNVNKYHWICCTEHFGGSYSKLNIEVPRYNTTTIPNTVHS